MSDENANPKGRLLSKLKEYREFIAIVAAALGGFVWFNNIVAKQNDLVDVKSQISTLARKDDLSSVEQRLALLATTDEVNRLNCLLDLYMTLTQVQVGQLGFKELRDENAAALRVVKTALETNENPATRQTLLNRQLELERKITLQEEKLAALEDEADQIDRDLKTDKCGSTT